MAKLSEKEKVVRREYSRLRSIAKKRISGLKAAGFGGTEFVKQWEFDLVPLREISNFRELVHAKLAAERFLENPYSRVSVQKDVASKIITTLDKRVDNKITKENLAEFGQFMDWARQKYKGLGFDSERAYDLFNARATGDDKISLAGLKSAYGQWRAKNL